MRRPALADATIVAHVFPTSYAAVDRELPKLHRQAQAGRASDVRAGAAGKDASAHRDARAQYGGAAARRRRRRAAPSNNRARRSVGIGDAGAGARGCLAAARAARVPAVLSRDAGRYLCNYLCWRAAEATRRKGGPRLAAFVHVPKVARMRAAAGQAAGDDAGRSRPRRRRISGDGRPPRLGRKAYLSKAHAGHPPLPPKAHHARDLCSILCPPRRPRRALRRRQRPAQLARRRLVEHRHAAAAPATTSRRACSCSPARTGAWKGIFAVHSWIVFKRANARDWTRYDVVGWGNPVRTNDWPPDGRWYGNTPVVDRRRIRRRRPKR